MAWQKPPDALVESFHQALPDDPAIARRNMFGYPSAFVGGHMACGLFQASIFVRLSAADRAQLLAVPGAHVFAPMPGRPMQEYVVLPPAIVADETALHSWLARAVSYGTSLPPKEAKPKTARPRAVAE